MDERKALDQTASSLMIVLCMVWGLQQVILKMAASDISPLMQIALRSGLAAYFYCRWCCLIKKVN